ncbi:MAG: fatty oxidation complex subunit alpha, partial [Bdellovibrionaceae bacterium]|nr:fatty oxidation complex subunit alpha [Pseudobdellovibrionaceae bacterium]
MLMNESIRIVDKGKVALVEFDLEGEKVNKFSTPVMSRLKEVVEELKTSSYKAVVFISRKKDIFVAGADIDEIKKMKKKEEYMDALTQAHEIFNLIEDLPMPTLAAINGACLGGGCEFIMCLDYRMATDSKKTRIG